MNFNYLSGTNSFAQLASNAPFFAGRVTSESVFTSESGTQRSFFEWVIDGSRLFEYGSGCYSHSLIINRRVIKIRHT
jgi:hypothetical protein